MSAETRLAVYGTLAPGEVNEHHMEGMAGDWRSGRVRGRLYKSRWGEHVGFPGMMPDPEGAWIPVQVFTSADLPANWPRLDAFEGEEYLRQPIEVEMEGESVTASIYALRRPGTPA